jgi:hypothetical protein
MIFNKNQTGAFEIKDLIGFIYASTNFDNLITYIGFAERDLKKIIGKELYAVAEGHYKSEHYFLAEADADHPEYAILDELVKKIQFPVAVNAYRRYVPSIDLQHSDKGRQITVTNEDKPAFEWQIEKDNENLISLANEGVDFLLEFLDDHIDDKAGTETDSPYLLPWGASKEFQATRELLIFNVDQLERIYSVKGSRLVYLSLVPFMRQVQDNEIRSCFSEEQWKDLKDQLLDGDFSDNNKVIIEQARAPLALLALSMAIRRLSVEILPDGLFTNQVAGVIKSKLATSKIDRIEVSEYLENDGQRELRKLQDTLKNFKAITAGVIETTADLSDRIDPDKKYARL